MQALAETIASDPDLTAIVVDAQYRNVEAPAELASMFDRVEQLPEDHSLVSPETTDALIKAMTDARRTGGATCVAARSDEPEVMRRVKIVDLVDDYGVLVLTISSTPVEDSANHAETVAPRIGRMLQGRRAHRS